MSVMHQCGACGRIVEGSVCIGPHPDFRLRTRSSEPVVELPEWCGRAAVRHRLDTERGGAVPGGDMSEWPEDLRVREQAG